MMLAAAARGAQFGLVLNAYDLVFPPLGDLQSNTSEPLSIWMLGLTLKQPKTYGIYLFVHCLSAQFLTPSFPLTQYLLDL